MLNILVVLGYSFIVFLLMIILLCILLAAIWFSYTRDFQLSMLKKQTDHLTVMINELEISFPVHWL